MFNQHDNQQIKKHPMRIILWAVIGVLIITLIIITSFATLISIGKNDLLKNDQVSIYAPESLIEAEENDGKIVYYKGQKYQFNEKMTNILLIGVDKENIEDTATETYGANGQADVLILIALDTSNGNMKAIPISRDTMVDINQYSVNGQYLGVSGEQICLSYSYGDGRELSCENTKTAVSRLLYGMPINSYVALDLEGIKILNDTIGGVTLTVDEDIDLYDKHLKKGDTVTLKGNYALRYIRGRNKTAIDANDTRMNRQKKYMKTFFKTALELTKKDIITPIKLYNKISDYKVSDLSVADISYLTQCVLLNKSTDSLGFVSIPGKNIPGKEYIEFHPDMEALYEIVIDTFYQPVSE